jgi:hypothetical protein
LPFVSSLAFIFKGRYESGKVFIPPFHWRFFMPHPENSNHFCGFQAWRPAMNICPDNTEDLVPDWMRPLKGIPGPLFFNIH